MNKIILSMLILISVFFLGRFSIKKETRIEIEKVRDEEAIQVAVAEAIKKTRLEFKQKIKINKIKMLDGTETFSKEITTESIKSEDSLKLETVDTKLKQHELIELKTPLKRFEIEISAGVAKNFKFEANLKYRLFESENFWIFTNFNQYGILYKINF
jgi:hypothetical protein